MRSETLMGMPLTARTGLALVVSLGLAGCNGCGSDDAVGPEVAGPILCVTSTDDVASCVDDGETLDWGSVTATNTVTRELLVTNVGDAPLTIGDASISGETPAGHLFSVEICDGSTCVAGADATAAILAPQASRQLRVTFEVSTDGPFPAESLRIVHDDPHDATSPAGVYVRPFVGTIDGCRDGFADANQDAGDGCECEIVEGAEEVCDGVDNDCDGVIDDGVAGTGITCDTGLTGNCGPGETACVDGVFGCVSTAPAVDEVCDGLDNDCDGAIDESGSWVEFNEGMSGGNMADVAFDPRHPGVVYALTGNRTYRSVDGGLTFSFMGEAPHTMRQLAFPPNDDQAILATGFGGVMRSLDDGETWSVISLGGLPVRAIMIHPADPARIYVGADVGGGIYRSTNGGTSFVPVNEGVPYSQITDFEGDPADADHVVASLVLLTPQGTFDNAGQILRTVNGGTNWTVVSDGIGAAYGLSACPGAPETIYAGVQADGLLKSVDGGASFTPIALANDVLRDVAVAPTDCSTIYTSLQPSGVHLSTDDGASFVGPLDAGMDVQFPFSVQLAVDPMAANRVVAANHSGVFVTEDYAASWTRPPGLNAVSVTELAVSDANPGRVWLSSWGQGVWTRTLAESWVKTSSSELPRDFIFTVVPDPYDMLRLMVGSWTDLWLSEDAGMAYSLTPQGNNPFDVGFHPTDSQVLYVATQTGGIFKSNDAGAVWMAINDGLPAPWATGACVCQDVRDIWVDPDTPDRVVAATNGKGIYRTENGGLTWVTVTPQLSNDAAGCLTEKGNMLFACVQGEGLWVSTDDGGSFSPLTQGNPELSNVGGLVVDDDTGELIATSDAGVFRSADDGASWEPVDNACLPSLGVGSPVILDDGSSRRLVVATGGAGVYALPW